jgi:hypothetical protein
MDHVDPGPAKPAVNLGIIKHFQGQPGETVYVSSKEARWKTETVSEPRRP